MNAPLQLVNSTPYKCGRYALTTKNGATFLRIVVKGGFDILDDGTALPSEEQPDIVMEDEYWGAPVQSSIKFESDLVLSKPGTDLLVHGEARAPGDRPTTQMLVSLSYQGRMLKQLHVSGDREWRRGILGWSASSAKPFTRMPIVYDRAYGGSDENGSEPRNRCGMGYATRAADLEGRPIPNIETPAQLIGSPAHHPVPAGFGVIARHWMPRMQYAGTYGDAWLSEQFPLLPTDFDDRFFHSAAQDQWISPPNGGEIISVHGMAPQGPLHVRLPSCAVPLRLRFNGGASESMMQPETVLLDTVARRCVITWGAGADIHGDPFRLKEIAVGDNKSVTVACCAST